MAIATRQPNHYLHGPRFDTLLIAGPMVVGLIAATVVAGRIELYLPAMLALNWIFAYEHLVGTYSRIVLDNQGYREHRWIVHYLPWGVAAFVAALLITGGIFLLFTIYFYWQWWHFIRQSEGIAKSYAMKAGQAPQGRFSFRRFVFYAVPALGYVVVFGSAQGRFMSLDIYMPPVTPLIIMAAHLLAGGLLIWWVIDQWRSYSAKTLSWPHTVYLASHFLVYYTAYFLFDNFAVGWLVTAFWHTGQYIAYVWLFNARRFGQGEEKESRLLSWLSQERRWGWYLAATVVAGALLSFMMESFTAALSTHGREMIKGLATATLFVPIIINLHHYVADTYIWKLRKENVAGVLGLSTEKISPA